MDSKLDKFFKVVGIFKWAMDNKLLAIIGFIVISYILYQLVGGIIWFFIETVIHMVLVMGLLIFLKKQGFFDQR